MDKYGIEAVIKDCLISSPMNNSSASIMIHVYGLIIACELSKSHLAEFCFGWKMYIYLLYPSEDFQYVITMSYSTDFIQSISRLKPVCKKITLSFVPLRSQLVQM
ncbi:hypothetical protein ACF0H5_019171 [Mactra antiquata]